jgi:hypothetical protein
MADRERYPPDLSRSTLPVWVAAISGAALLSFMFFAWFGSPDEVQEVIDQTNTIADQLGGQRIEEVGAGVDAWSSLRWFEIAVLVAAILFSVSLAVVAASNKGDRLPDLGAVTAAVGTIAFLLILYRIFDPPLAGELEIGALLGLLATAGIVAGSFLTGKESILLRLKWLRHFGGPRAPSRPRP